MLTIIQVGNNEASNRYIRNKMRSIEEAGMECELVKLPENCETEDILMAIGGAHVMKESKAIMVQLPLPDHIQKDVVLRTIPTYKDIDGLNPLSDYKPLTPCAIMRWFKENNIKLEGKLVTVLGRSELVGKPIAEMLIDAGATVTVCNSKTPVVVKEDSCYRADIIISAVGKAGVVDKFDISRVYRHDKPKIVVDVGINRDENGKLCGDVSAEARKAIAASGGYCTPVPGGVGKWTVNELLIRLASMETGMKLS